MIPRGKDGESHINIYSRGETPLGRWMSNFTKCSLELGKHGHFSSIEGYWYWLGARDERLRTLYGFSAKKLGRSLPRRVELDIEVFQGSIEEAIRKKLAGAPAHIFHLFKESTLPFTHYYVLPSGKKLDAGYKWIIDIWEHLRKEIQAALDEKRLRVFTSTLRNRNVPSHTRLDITVKSGDKIFAPTWDMVMKHKRGEISDEEYARLYYERMRRSYQRHKERWKEVLQMGTVVFCCFCPSGQFCHRLLLADIFEKLGAKKMGERWEK